MKTNAINCRIWQTVVGNSARQTRLHRYLYEAQRLAMNHVAIGTKIVAFCIKGFIVIGWNQRSFSLWIYDSNEIRSSTRHWYRIWFIRQELLWSSVSSRTPCALFGWSRSRHTSATPMSSMSEENRSGAWSSGGDPWSRRFYCNLSVQQTDLLSGGRK